MRFFVFSLLAIAAVSAEDPNGSPDSALLRRIRESNKTTEKNCVPLKLFKKFCNTCICAADGKSSTCTNNKCVEGVYAEDGSLLPYNPDVKHYCVPEKRFKVNCNDCWCDFNGITAMCTAEPCADPACEPNKSFRRDCDECTCSADGHELTCLRKYCPYPSW